MKIEMVRGTTQQLALTLVDSDTGAAFAVQSSDVLRFAVETPVDNVVLRKSVTGSTTITLTPSDTASLNPGRYWYDIGLERGNNYFQVVPRSPFVLIDNVSAKGV